MLCFLFSGNKDYEKWSDGFGMLLSYSVLKDRLILKTDLTNWYIYSLRFQTNIRTTLYREAHMAKLSISCENLSNQIHVSDIHLSFVVSCHLELDLPGICSIRTHVKTCR